MLDTQKAPKSGAKIKGKYIASHYAGGKFIDDFKDKFRWTMLSEAILESFGKVSFKAYHYFDSKFKRLSLLLFHNAYVDRFEICNLITDEGLNYLLDAGLSAATQKTLFYIGVFKGNYTPDGTETGASVVTDATEVVKTTDIDETARQQWVEAGVSGQAITNAASPAVYTFAATVSVYGMFLISDATMPTPGAGAVCIGIARFPSVRNMVDNDVLNITYQISAADDGV